MAAEVIVLSLSGEQLASLSCKDDTTVAEIKDEVNRRGGPIRILQMLTWQDRKLNDSETCGSLGWEGEVTLCMVVTKDLNAEQNIKSLMESKGDAHVDLPESELKTLCELACEVFLSEPPILEMAAPCVVVGTLAGDLPQLRRIFAMCGSTRYVCLGHYADRGEYGIETLTLLLLHKCKSPERMALLRGRFECASLSRIYGFYDECKRRYSPKLWKDFTAVHNTMPWACVVQNSILCVHSGLSSELTTLEPLKKVVRPRDEGFLADLLWAVPNELYRGFSDDPIREGNFYGADVVESFLQMNSLEMMVRTGLVDEGYEWFADKRLVSIISTPNYMKEMKNSGAIMFVDERAVRFESYGSSVPFHSTEEAERG